MLPRFPIRSALFLLVALLLARPAYGADGGKRPNVLFIAVDDLNHWVGYLGRNPQAKTPHIDALARRGVAFTRAYCTAPACEPSRCSLMGGKRPWTSGCYQNGDGWKNYQPPGEGLSAQFLKAGYHVAGAGKIYHGDSYYPEEWTEYMPKQGHFEHGPKVDKDEGFHKPLAHDLKDEDISDWHAVNWCCERLKRPSDKPLFLACGLHKPHLPFAAPKKYYDLFPLATIQLPPYQADDLSDIPPAGVRMAKPEGDHAQFVRDGNWKEAIQAYLACCAYTDMNLGRLLQALDEGPHKNNTIIVFWGDHGWSFGEKNHWRKFALWEEPTRAPLLIVAPGVTKPSRCERTVDFLSLYPTLCELAGLPIPQHAEGKSLLPLLTDPAAKWDAPAITTHGYQNHAVRTERWRYIRYAGGDEELYDCLADPYEWTNLAGKPDLAQVKTDLARHLPLQPAPHKAATGKAADSKPGAAKKEGGKKKKAAPE